MGPDLAQAFVSRHPARPTMGCYRAIVKSDAVGAFLTRGRGNSRHSRLSLSATATSALSTLSAPRPFAHGGGGDGDRKKKSTKATLIAAAKSLYFPFYVLLAGLLGATRPQLYDCLSEMFITRALSAVMVLMGMTLSVDDFARIGGSKRVVALGWCAQFSIMPTVALLMSRLFRLPPHLAAGVVLVGCCPGGTASNLVTLLANADVALSISMTAVSTLTAGVMTPLLTSLLLGSLVPVDTTALLRTTLQVVLLPVILGLLTNTYLLPSLSPSLTHALSRITPVLSGLLVAAICGKVVATNAGAVAQAGVPLLGAIVTLHVFGFFFGFLMARLLGFNRQVAKTVSIETGMQNSALAVVLARSSLPHPLSGLPGAVSAVCHSVLGSVLAWVWSREAGKKGAKEECE